MKRAVGVESVRLKIYGDRRDPAAFVAREGATDTRGTIFGDTVATLKDPALH